MLLHLVVFTEVTIVHSQLSPYYTNGFEEKTLVWVFEMVIDGEREPVSANV